MKKSKAPYIIIAVVLIIAAAAYFLINFIKSDKNVSEFIVPEVEKVGMQLKGLTSDRADMIVNMIVRNPSPVGIDIDSIYYIISVEGTEIARTSYPDPLSLRARDTTAVSIPLSVKYRNYKEMLDRMEKEGRDSGNYHINATVFLNSRLISKKQFDMEFDKVLPLIWYPEVSLKGIDLDKVRLNGGIIQMETEVSNKNRFDITFRDLSYRMKLGDNDWIEGKKPEVVNIPAKGTAKVDMPVEVKLGEMGKSLFDMITKGGDLQYDMKMQARIVSASEAIKNSKIEINASGNMRSLKEAVKNNSK